MKTIFYDDEMLRRSHRANAVLQRRRGRAVSVFFCSDCHHWNHRRHGGPMIRGVNRRGDLGLRVQERVKELVGFNRLVVCGDLVDSCGPISPQLAHRLRRALPVNTDLIPGNHDAAAEGDDALALYKDASEGASVSVHRDISFDFYVSVESTMTFVPYWSSIDDERVRDCDVVCAHFGAYDDGFAPHLRRCKGARGVKDLFAWMQKRGVKVLLLGDWHGRRIWRQHREQIISVSEEPGSAGTYYRGHEGESDDEQRLIMQVGALVPTGFDNKGLRGYGTLAEWDGERLSWRELPGPRFCVARSDEEEKAVIAEAAALGHNLFLRRYYSGAQPDAPPGVEAYEAIPVAIERVAEEALLERQCPEDLLQSLVGEWLEQQGTVSEALRGLLATYV